MRPYKIIKKDTRERIMKQSEMVLFNIKLLIISISLFIYREVWDFRSNQELFLKLFITIALALWLVDCIKRESFSKVKTVLDLPLLIFIFIMAVSTSRSPALFSGMKDLLIFCSYFLIYFLIVNNLKREEQITSFISCLFILVAIIAVYSILQYYSFDPYLGHLNHITSTLGLKNWVSDYVAMIFPLLLFFFLIEGVVRKKVIYHLLLALLWINLMICQTRSIWISFILCSLLGIYLVYKFKLFPIFRANKKWLLSLVIIFILITVIYSTENPLNRAPLTVPEKAVSILSLQEPSIKSRLLIWNTTFDMIKDSPILGIGLGAFELNYLKYQAGFLESHPEYINVNGKAGEAHNEYLQMAAELGLIGLLLFLLIIGLFYKSSLNFIRKINQDRKRLIILGLGLGITSTLIHSLASFPFHVPALGAVFFLLVGLTMAYGNMSLPNSPNCGNCDDNEENLKEEEEEDRKSKNREVKSIKSVLKIFIIAILLILTVLLVNNFAIKPYLAEVYYFQGLKDTFEEEYKRALPKLEYALELDPHNGRILHTLGDVCYNLGDWGRAIEFSRLAVKYRMDKRTFRNLGLFYLAASLYKEAEDNFIYAIYLDPKYSEAYQNLGQLYYLKEGKGDLDRAINIWNKGLEMNANYSNNYVLYYNLGLAYNKKGLAEEALINFNKVLELTLEENPYHQKVKNDIIKK
jgi:O-antigen ligase/cytochrome c-type biogenesis protein CcmH/NrfG